MVPISYYAGALFVLLYSTTVFGHVRLTFPKARYPALDFLDNARTRPTCGVTKPPGNLGIRTTVQSGTAFNISWFMSYAHQGGFRIEILNPLDQPIHVLTPEDVQYTGSNNINTQSYQVKLPKDFECYNCAIRLLRQATEWGSYQFWSCADVNIVKDGSDDLCSGHGRLTPAGGCLCDRLYTGRQCQFKDECWADHECGVNGKCQEMATPSGPKRICYCKTGWFGPNCNSPSALRKFEFDDSLYQKREVGGDKNKIFWRIIEETEELEMILQFPGRSWVAVGWKPKNINPQCANLVQYALGYNPDLSVPEPHPEGEVSVSEPEPELSIPHPEGEAKPEPYPEGEAKPEPHPEGEAKPEPYPEGEAKPEPHPEGEAKPEPHPEGEAKPEPHPEGETHAEPHPEGESTTNVERTTHSPFLPNLPTIKPFIGDAYTSPGTPEIVTANTGSTYHLDTYPDMVLTVEIPIITDAPTEVTEEKTEQPPVSPFVLTPGPNETNVGVIIKPIVVQPAIPVEPIDRHPVTEPPIAIEPTPVLIQPLQPIVNVPDATEPKEAEVIGDVCYGDWRWPANCRDCDYRVSWTYVDDSDEVEFSIETKAPTNWWTGIGLSKTGSMAGADMIIIKSRRGRLSLHDMFSEAYGRPRLDKQQDAYTPTVIGTHVNGVLRASFTRKRNTGDAKDDLQFTDSKNSCFYFLFPVTGGRLNANGDISKHLAPPQVSKTKVCVRSCLSATNEVPSEETLLQQTCQREYRFPAGCVGIACDYVATWQYNEARDDITFKISAKEIGRWTGIGFSRDGAMTSSDIYTGWVYDGRAYITDRFAYGRQLPAIDPNDRQDIYKIGGEVEDDVQTIWFTRKIVTDDSLTDFPLNKCYYFLFPIGGGRVLARQSDDFKDSETPIGYHDLYQPRASRDKICICTDRNVPLHSRTKRQSPVGHPEPHAEIPAEPKPEEEVQPEPKAIGIPEPKTQPEGHAEPHPEPNPEGKPEPHPEPKSEGHPEPHAEGRPEPHPETHPEPHSEGEPKTEPEGHPEPKGEPEVEPEGSHEHSHSHEHEGTESKLHAMDCTDIIVGSAVGTLHKVDDYYTISRATPMIDEIYGGQQSLTAANGFERDGITTIMFRRKLNSSDSKGDHPIIRGPMSLIWAKGQESANSYYELDILKYHGRKNRGEITIDFFEKKDQTIAYCTGQFSYPDGCTGSACIYSISWKRQEHTVEFELDAKVQPGQWSGIGFSKDGNMAGADMILVLVDKNGQIQITDRFSPGYGRPEIDSDQHVFNPSGSYIDGRVKAKFSRGITTPDSKNDVDLAKCQHFLYPYSAGNVLGDGPEVSKHYNTPYSTSEPICLMKCLKLPVAEPVPEKEPNAESDASPENVHKAGFLQSELSSNYILSLRILNRDWSPLLEDEKTTEYQVLSDNVITAVNQILQAKLPGYTAVHVIQYREGSVIADIEVEADGQKPIDKTKQSIVQAVKPAFSAAQVQGLRVDPDTIEVIAKPATESGLTPEELRNYVIIGVACLLVLIAIIFAICMIVRTKKTKSKDFKANSRYIPFSPYSYMLNNGYAGTYPAGTYQYPPGAVAEKNKGFENQGYHPDYRAQGGHNRQFSNATTATPPNNGKTPSPGASGSNGSDSPKNRSPAGVGETTYSEWYQKVASQPQSQQHQESNERGAAQKPGRQSKTGPYVSYPNDPYSYYTMNGQNRVPPRGAMPQPGYYRPY